MMTKEEFSTRYCSLFYNVVLTCRIFSVFINVTGLPCKEYMQSVAIEFAPCWGHAATILIESFFSNQHCLNPSTFGWEFNQVTNPWAVATKSFIRPYSATDLKRYIIYMDVISFWSAMRSLEKLGLMKISYFKTWWAFLKLMVGSRARLNWKFRLDSWIFVFRIALISWASRVIIGIKIWQIFGKHYRPNVNCQCPQTTSLIKRQI